MKGTAAQASIGAVWNILRTTGCVFFAQDDFGTLGGVAGSSRGARNKGRLRRPHLLPS
ncbi:MAG: hypothetical protein JWP15_1068 [Alphaproteobacteria bacterium]|nr:hypothetical protein [Alphaproteobacteria bacterium]